MKTVRLTITGKARRLVKEIEVEHESVYDEKEIKDKAILSFCNQYLRRQGMKEEVNVDIARKLTTLTFKAEIL